MKHLILCVLSVLLFSITADAEETTAIEYNGEEFQNSLRNIIRAYDGQKSITTKDLFLAIAYGAYIRSILDSHSYYGFLYKQGGQAWQPYYCMPSEVTTIQVDRVILL